MKKNVLIIEDDIAIQHIVTYILESAGYQVTGTSHAPVAELAQYRADLILLDEWVNKNAGHMLCKEIKAMESLRRTPVIIFSTANDIHDIVKKCGAAGFIQKPFDIDVLLNEIHKYLPLNPLEETV